MDSQDILDGFDPQDNTSTGDPIRDSLISDNASSIQPAAAPKDALRESILSDDTPKKPLSEADKREYSRAISLGNFVKDPINSLMQTSKDVMMGYPQQLASGAQSAYDLATGNFNSTDPTQQTKDLAQKYKSGTAKTSDYSNALLSQVAQSPGGKFANVIGSVVPGYNMAGNVMSHAINPAVEAMTGIAPSDLEAGELLGGTALGAKFAPEASGKNILSPYSEYKSQPSIAPISDNMIMKAISNDNTSPNIVSNKLASMGPNAMLSDAAGENTRGLARAIGNMPGPAKEIAQQALEERQVGQSDRITQAALQGLGVSPSDIYGDVLSKLDKQQSDQAAPLYQEAFSANKNISSPIIDRVLSTDAGQTALKFAARRMNNRQALMGVPDPELAEQAKLVGSYEPGGIASGLKLETLDLVKQGLDDQIGNKFRNGENGEAKDLIGLKNGFLKELDNQDVTAKAGPNSTKPEGGAYAQARSAYADKASAKDALDSGYDYVTKGDFTALSSLKDAQKPYFRIGVANKISDILQNTSDGADSVKRIFGSPAKRAKLASVFPDADSFKKFEDTVNNEKEFTKTYQAVTKGSRTAPLAEDIADTSNSFNRAAQTAKGLVKNGIELSQRNTVGKILYAGSHIMNKLSEPTPMSDNESIALANKLFTRNGNAPVNVPNVPIRTSLMHGYINHLIKNSTIMPSFTGAVGNTANQPVDNP